MFLGRCFAFEFKSRLSDKTPSSLSTILRQNGLGMTRGCQQSLIASRIRPTTAITRDTTVLAGIEGYLQQLESLGNESATCTQGAVSHSHSVQSTCCDHDSSSLLYQSGKQENSQCIALVSYNCEDTGFVPVLTPPAHPLAVTTPQLNDSSKVSSCVCDSKEADSSSVPELCDESSYHFFDTISTQDIQCACDERQVTGPSHDEECTAVYSDLEANEIVQELIADWKSTQIQEPQSNPLAEGNEEDVELEFTTTQLSSPVKEFSPSALSTDFLTSFMGSFDVCTTPEPTRPTRHCVFSSVHRPGVVETPSFSASAHVSYPGETPELFSGSRTPCPLSVLNTIGSSTDASPELFGSSKPHQHLFPRVANSCIRMPLFVTPSASAKTSQPRRTIIQELNIASPSMDQMRSAPIQSRHTKISGPPLGGTPLEEKCASSPDLFSP